MASTALVQTTVVTLTPDEIMESGTVGLNRHVESNVRRKHSTSVGVFNGEEMQQNILGACGEMAFAKWADIFWARRLNNFKGADFGELIQVRTRSKDFHGLYARAEDNDNHIFVLLRSHRFPTFEIVGWAWGREIKANDAWKKGYNGWKPAWFMPPDQLHGMDSFPWESVRPR